MALLRPLEIEVRYVRADWDPVVTTLGGVDVEGVVRGRPVRQVRSQAGRRHYCGVYWSATTGTHIGFESRLELDRLLLADFDRGVEWMASQPFWLSGPDGPLTRRHVPDLLLKLGAGRYLVVDVKPEQFAAVPEVAAVFTWTGRLCAERGWGYEVWTGGDRAVLDNLRFLAMGRRGEFIDPEALRAVRGAIVAGMTVGEVCAAAAGAGACSWAVRPALFSVLWVGEWTVDLKRPLSSASVIRRADTA